VFRLTKDEVILYILFFEYLLKNPIKNDMSY